jgi:Ca2+-binding RTX toxin-like protein
LFLLGDGNDVVTVIATVQPVTIDTRGGQDTINIEAAEANVTVRAGSGADTINLGNRHGVVDDLHAEFSLDGGTGIDKLFVKNSRNTQPGEYFLFGGALTYNTVTHTHDDLDIYPVAVEEITASAGSGPDSFTVSGVPSGAKATFNGGSGNDRLQGPDTANVWSITANSGGQVNSTLVFTSIGHLFGGANDDRFVFSNGKHVDWKVEGGAGLNTLDYSPYLTPVEVNVQSLTATGTVAGFFDIQAVRGGSDFDQLIGPDQDATWTIIEQDRGLLDWSMTDDGAQMSFLNVENLTGGTRKDHFRFSDNAGVRGKVTGGDDSDTLDYGLFSTSNPIEVNLRTATATKTGGIEGIDRVAGGASPQDRLLGKGGSLVQSVWNITALNEGNLTGPANVAFSAIESLTAAPGQDRFVFQPASGLTGSLDGGSEGTLDYSAYDLAVTVDLFAGTALGVSGTVSNIRNVTGSAFADTLLGDGHTNLFRGGGGKDVLQGLGGADILLGGGDEDQIDGGAGRDLVFGGAGGDVLAGGLDDDILIGGETAHDSNDAVLRAMLSVWTQASLDYLPRRDQLLNVGVLGGLYKLDTASVLDDGAADQMTGGSSLDWFWAHALDTVLGLEADEEIDP